MYASHNRMYPAKQTFVRWFGPSLRGYAPDPTWVTEIALQ